VPFVLALKLGKPGFQVRWDVLGGYRFDHNRAAAQKAKEYPNLRYLGRDHTGPEALFGEMLSKSLQRGIRRAVGWPVTVNQSQQPSHRRSHAVLPKPQVPRESMVLLPISRELGTSEADDVASSRIFYISAPPLQVSQELAAATKIDSTGCGQRKLTLQLFL
jgi:hypothetical protein